MAGVRVGGAAALPPITIAYRNFYFGGGPDSITGIWTLPGPAKVNSVTSDGPIAAPNGQYVAFEGSGHDLYVCDIDGSNQTLLDNTLTTHAISWHPNSSKILYRVGGDIRTIRPDGTDLTTVVSVTNCREPLYNRNGTLIAYIVQNTPGAADELWVMNADGTGQTMVAQAPGTGANGVISVFSWARTSDKLVYQKANGSGTSPLWTVLSDGTGETQITTATISCTRWAWAQDDSVIVAYGSGGTTLYTVDPAGGGETSLGITRDNTGGGGPEIWGNRMYYIDGTLENLMSAALDGSDQVKEDGDDFTTYYCQLAEDIA